MDDPWNRYKTYKDGQKAVHDKRLDDFVYVVVIGIIVAIPFYIVFTIVSNYIGRVDPFYGVFVDSFIDTLTYITWVLYFIVVALLYFLSKAYSRGEIIDKYGNRKTAIVGYSVCALIGTVALGFILILMFLPSGAFSDIAMARRGEHHTLETRLNQIRVNSAQNPSIRVYHLTVLDEQDGSVIIRQEITGTMYRDLRNEIREIQDLQRQFGELWESAWEMLGHDIPIINVYYLPHTQTILNFSVIPVMRE